MTLWLPLLPLPPNPHPLPPLLSSLPAGHAEGTEFLTTLPPWKCTICNVTCTSQDTLLGHAAGAKHKRRVRAAHQAAQLLPPPHTAQSASTMGDCTNGGFTLTCTPAWACAWSAAQPLGARFHRGTLAAPQCCRASLVAAMRLIARARLVLSQLVDHGGCLLLNALQAKAALAAQNGGQQQAAAGAQPAAQQQQQPEAEPAAQSVAEQQEDGGSEKEKKEKKDKKDKKKKKKQKQKQQDEGDKAAAAENGAANASSKKKEKKKKEKKQQKEEEQQGAERAEAAEAAEAAREAAAAENGTADDSKKGKKDKKKKKEKKTENGGEAAAKEGAAPDGGKKEKKKKRKAEEPPAVSAWGRSVHGARTLELCSAVLIFARAL